MYAVTVNFVPVKLVLQTNFTAVNLVPQTLLPSKNSPSAVNSVLVQDQFYCSKFGPPDTFSL